MFLSIFTPNCVWQLKKKLYVASFRGPVRICRDFSRMPESFKGRNILAHDTRKSTGNAHSSLFRGVYSMDTVDL